MLEHDHDVIKLMYKMNIFFEKVYVQRKDKHIEYLSFHDFYQCILWPSIEFQKLEM